MYNITLNFMSVSQRLLHGKYMTKRSRSNTLDTKGKTKAYNDTFIHSYLLPLMVTNSFFSWVDLRLEISSYSTLSDGITHFLNLCVRALHWSFIMFREIFIVKMPYFILYMYVYFVCRCPSNGTLQRDPCIVWNKLPTKYRQHI